MGFDEVGKKVLLGIGLATTFLILGSGLIVGGAFLDVLVGSVAMSAIVVGASAIMYKLCDNDEKENIKKEFRKLSSDDVGAIFAVKATLIEEAKIIMDKQSFDEFLDANLRLVNDLRADTEFMLLVENKDVEETTKKIKCFNNWTNRLSTLLVSYN